MSIPFMYTRWLCWTLYIQNKTVVFLYINSQFRFFLIFLVSETFKKKKLEFMFRLNSLQSHSYHIQVKMSASCNTSSSSSSCSDIIFFWGKASPFSQFHACRFHVDEVLYSCTEQYMMSSKARLFGDDDMNVKIMNASCAKQMKGYGRKVCNFNDETWAIHRYDIVVRGNYAKFSQNAHLKQCLLETYPKVLAEASPFDKIWGIGLRESHPNAKQKETWNGLNLLGEALMQVRLRIMQEEEE